MNNKNISDFIASTMASVLDSKEHQQLFGTQRKKVASKHCKDCHKAMDKCLCSMADDQNMEDEPMFDEPMVEEDEPMFDEPMVEEDEPMFEGEGPMGGIGPANVELYADDGDSDEMASTASFDVAIEGLLTASAALDYINMNRSSDLSLKLASLVVQAKKVQEEEKSTKSKSKKKKLTSKDFKKMLKEDDDGKLTAANFKKIR